MSTTKVWPRGILSPQLRKHAARTEFGHILAGGPNYKEVLPNGILSPQLCNTLLAYDAHP